MVLIESASLLSLFHPDWVSWCSISRFHFEGNRTVLPRYCDWGRCSSHTWLSRGKVNYKPCVFDIFLGFLPGKSSCLSSFLASLHAFSIAVKRRISFATESTNHRTHIHHRLIVLVDILIGSVLRVFPKAGSRLSFALANLLLVASRQGTDVAIKNSMRELGAQRTAPRGSRAQYL